jgi:hypothetical protein
MLFLVFKNCVGIVFFMKRHLAITVVGLKLQEQIAQVLEI